MTVNPRRSGKNGQVYAQISTTAVTGESLTANTTSEVVNGVTYPAYTVYTAAHPLMVDNPYPVLTETFADANTQRITNINFELGKVIVTPAGVSGDTVVASYSYALVQPIGNMHDWKLSIKLESVDVTAFLDGWHNRVATFRDWSGSADEYQVNNFWFNACAQNNFLYVKLYPDYSVTEYWVGKAIFDYDLSVPFNGAVAGAIKFVGNGSLSYKIT